MSWCPVATEALALTRTVPNRAVVHVIDGAQLSSDQVDGVFPRDGILLAHAISPIQRDRLLAGRTLGFSACARLSPAQLAPLREAAAEHAQDDGELPEAMLPTALSALRNALTRALPADSGLSLAITAASRRFGVCLHLPGDAGEASLNAPALGLGVWSLRCQQAVHVPALGADARAAQDLDYCRGGGEEGLPAITAVCGERIIGGAPAWLALTVRGAALTDPQVASAKRAMLEALLRALSTEVVPSWEGRRARLFRAEALADHNEDVRLLPLQLLLAPPWTRRGVQVLATGLVLLAIAMFAPVRDRVGTSALLSLDGVITVSATAPGRVLSVFAVPGQHMAADAPLAQLSDSAATADAERAYADYVALLRRRLAHTDAAAADATLAQAWERLQQARAAAQPQLHVPRAGRMLDLSIARGQQVAAGESLLQFAPDDGVMQLDLDLPARAASRLHAGATGSARMTSTPYGEFPIRVVWVAQTLASTPASAASSAQTASHMHAHAVFIDKQPSGLPGSRADVRIDLGTEPLFRLLYQRWMEG
jgi:hypothetical protein